MTVCVLRASNHRGRPVGTATGHRLRVTEFFRLWPRPATFRPPLAIRTSETARVP